MTARGSYAKTRAIVAARLIARGDVDTARAMLRGRRSFRSFEARAIAGACLYAREVLGAPDTCSLASFAGVAY